MRKSRLKRDYEIEAIWRRSDVKDLGVSSPAQPSVHRMFENPTTSQSFPLKVIKQGTTISVNGTNSFHFLEDLYVKLPRLKM